MRAAPTAQDHSGLPVIGPAPDFVLRAQDGAEVALNKFRGNAVAVAFIFASCSATCPILIAKMAAVRDQLGSDFGPKIAFLSITVDSDHDTPKVLQRHADTFGVNPIGWKFLTGSPAVIQDIERQYGAFAAGNAGGKARPRQSCLTGRLSGRGTLLGPVGHAIFRYGYLFDRLI